jgi:hypothetical protein
VNSTDQSAHLLLADPGKSLSEDEAGGKYCGAEGAYPGILELFRIWVDEGTWFFEFELLKFEISDLRFEVGFESSSRDLRGQTLKHQI